MLLPSKVDRSPSGKIKARAEMGQKGYMENTEFHLVVGFSKYNEIEINYRSENCDEYLSDSEIKYIIKNLCWFENEEEELIQGNF